MTRFKSFVIAAIITVWATSLLGQTAKPANLFRVDYDGSYTIWLVQERGHVLVDVLTSTAGWAEIDAGPIFTIGGLSIYPLVGIDFNNSPVIVGSFIPQLYLFYRNDRIDLGSWFQFFLNRSGNSFYFRDYVTVSGIVPLVSVGPQFEGTLTSDAQEVLVGGRLKYDIKLGEFVGFIGGNPKDGSSIFRLTYLVPF